MARGTACELFDVPVSAMTMDEALDLVQETIAIRGRLHIGVVNAAKIVNMRRDDELKHAVLSSDVIFADGMAVVWASRLLGRPLPERVAGIDLMHGMLARGNDRGYRVYCLGATETVIGRVRDYISETYPNVQVVGHHHGYFSEEDESCIVTAIAAVNPDILLVGMTSPKKERFLARWTGTLAVPVCHGVGGSFDVIAGTVRRAPESWQRLGLEWLYRVKQEPRRLWKRYLLTKSMFLDMLLVELARRFSASLLK